MKTAISGVRIRALCSVVPSNISKFEDELKDFPFSEHSSRRLAQVMGFKEHRVADPKTTLVDLGAFGVNYLFDKKVIDKESLSALIFVAQENDHPIPGNSKILHGLLGLSQDTHCIDLYENCIGFISGLYTAATMLKASDLENVIVVSSNSGSCYGNKKDRNIYPLIGDAAGIVVVSKSKDPSDTMYFDFHHDGTKSDTLLVPAGGMRMPHTEKTSELVKDDMGNYRSLEQLHMDGTAVFHFVMENVPPIIDEITSYANISKDKIEYHITHQPNRFMLEKLADLLEVPREKLFNNIVENFGNSSCATIPVNIAFNLGEKLLKDNYLVCMTAFGAGMSVGATICNLGNLDCCSLIEHPCNGSNDYPQKI